MASIHLHGAPRGHTPRGRHSPKFHAHIHTTCPRTLQYYYIHDMCCWIRFLYLLVEVIGSIIGSILHCHNKNSSLPVCEPCFKAKLTTRYWPVFREFCHKMSSVKAQEKSRQTIFYSAATFPRPFRELYRALPRIYYEFTANLPQIYREFPTILPWFYREFTASISACIYAGISACIYSCIAARI
jgi:hypothetical protein